MKKNHPATASPRCVNQSLESAFAITQNPDHIGATGNGLTAVVAG